MSSNVQLNIPDWYRKHTAPAMEFLSKLDPFPFDQPQDISRYVALHHNDYLRLGNHPAVVEARTRANESNRSESFLSSVYGGASNECAIFAGEIAACMGTDDVMLTTSGWAANVGLLEAITPLFTPVYLDQAAHASLYDGAKLSLGKKVVVNHNDPDHLVERIAANGPGIVCIDAVYSTDGSIGDIRRYVEICEEHDCLLVLDEAHSFGLFGRGGGLAVELGLADRVHFRTVSLNKALGGHGGFIAGSREMMRMVQATCRPVIFSSATSSVSAAGHRAALKIIRDEPDRARRCLDNASQLRSSLRDRGIGVGDSQCQIVSIVFDSEGEACRFYQYMRDKHVLTSVFVYPATPPGQGLVRFSVHSELEWADIVYVVECVHDYLNGARRAATAHQDTRH